MSTDESGASGWLRRRTAEEIRVLLARRMMSAAELARRTGMKQSTLARRMTGETAFDLDDLEAIAQALGVAVQELLPSAETVAKSGQAEFGYRLEVAGPRMGDPKPARPRDNRPPGRAVGAPPPSVRRTALIDRPRRPKRD
jgi:transcriptional regulator with XRE-family HTH domain